MCAIERFPSNGPAKMNIKHFHISEYENEAGIQISSYWSMECSQNHKCFVKLFSLTSRKGCKTNCARTATSYKKWKEASTMSRGMKCLLKSSYHNIDKICRNQLGTAQFYCHDTLLFLLIHSKIPSLRHDIPFHFSSIPLRHL